MSLKDPPIIHGADHCPGGPDPIPCLDALVSRVQQFGAPRIHAGVYRNHYEDGPYYTLWPGGLVVQALNPFRVGPASEESSSTHRCHIVGGEPSLVTQQAASKAAADVCFSFTARQAGLDSKFYPHPISGEIGSEIEYDVLLGLKLTGTANDVGISFQSSNPDHADADFTLTSAGRFWGKTHYAAVEIALSSVWDAPMLADELIEIKIWAGGAGSNMHVSHLYWLPQVSDGAFITETTGHWIERVSAYNDYLSATSTFVEDENVGRPTDANGRCIADTQVVEGLFDPTYAVSFGGNGNDVFASSWSGTQGYYMSEFTASRVSYFKHEYQLARMSLDDRDQGNFTFATLYEDTFPHAQAALTSQDWGLIYYGPRFHDHAHKHWGIWAPNDTAAGFYTAGVPLDEAAYNDSRLGDLYYFYDFITRPIAFVPWP